MISVIVPHLNQPDGLEACLRSLEAQSLARELFEIIVVDNGSHVPPVDVIARHSSARLLHETRPGPGPARNAGVAAAKGEILAFIDADCRAHQDWLRNAQGALASAPAGTILGGDVRIWQAGKNGLNAIEAYESVFAYRFQLYIEQHGYSGTGNLVAYRRDVETIGPFAGIDVAEDMEWGRRARAAGFHFRYIPDMIVFHPARGSLQELYAKWDRQILHYRNMAGCRPAWRLRWLGRALLLLGSPLISAVTVLTSDRIQGHGTRCKAIAVLCAVRLHRALRMISLLRGDRTMIWNR